MDQIEKRILWEKLMGMRTDNGGIDDLFADGGVCDRLYERISAAQHRLLDRLGVQECRDMDEILNLEDEICMHVATRMFDYGVEYGQNGRSLSGSDKNRRAGE